MLRCTTNILFIGICSFLFLLSSIYAQNSNPTEKKITHLVYCYIYKGAMVNDKIQYNLVSQPFFVRYDYKPTEPLNKQDAKEYMKLNEKGIYFDLSSKLENTNLNTTLELGISANIWQGRISKNTTKTSLVLPKNFEHSSYLFANYIIDEDNRLFGSCQMNNSNSDYFKTNSLKNLKFSFDTKNLPSPVATWTHNKQRDYYTLTISFWKTQYTFDRPGTAAFSYFNLLQPDNGGGNRDVKGTIEVK